MPECGTCLSQHASIQGTRRGRTLTELLPLSSAILSGHVDLVLCIPYYMSLGSVGTRLRISMCADDAVPQTL